jgi:LmbE family N-acetylglucosaminyl deacetylase
VRERANLGRPDGELVNDDPLRAELALHVRRKRPELVLTHDPRTLWNVYGGRAHPGHSDHRAAGQAVLDALYPRAASRTSFPSSSPSPASRPGIRARSGCSTPRAPTCTSTCRRRSSASSTPCAREARTATGCCAARARSAGGALRAPRAAKGGACDGECLCGGVRYEVTGKLAPLGYCHCKQCQRASGSAFSCNTTVAKADFRLVSG